MSPLILTLPDIFLKRQLLKSTCNRFARQGGVICKRYKILSNSFNKREKPFLLYFVPTRIERFRVGQNGKAVTAREGPKWVRIRRERERVVT